MPSHVYVNEIGPPKWVGPPLLADSPYQPLANGQPITGAPGQSPLPALYGMVFNGKNYQYQVNQSYVFNQSVLDESGVMIVYYWPEGQTETERTEGPYDAYTDSYFVVNEFPEKKYGVFEMRAVQKDRDVYRVRTKEIP